MMKQFSIHIGTRNFIAVVTVGLLMSLLGVVMATHSTHALSSLGPDSGDYGNAARYTLEDTGQLRVTSSTVPVYYANNPGTITVSSSSYSFENTTGKHPKVSFNGGASVQSNYNFSLGGFTYDANTGYWVALINMQLTGQAGTNGVISYKLNVPSPGIIGSYTANGSNSAVSNQDRCDSRDRSGCGHYYNYNLPFGTPCQAQGSTTLTATIYDGDNGNVGVQPTNFSISIYDETDGRSVAITRSGSEANGQVARYAFTAQPYHKYRFKVNNAYSNNVMQINLPADGIYYLSDCRTIEQTDRIYGSWGEYGVTATGNITGIGSGSAFAGRGLAHATTCSYTFLTFANASTSTCKSAATSDYGKYTTGRTIPDVATTYPVSAAGSSLSGTNVNVGGLSGIYRTSGDIVITGGTLQKGKTVVINTYDTATKKYKNVTIAGDIKYTTDSLTSVDQIPQLIILGNNISIRSNVVQVDAWLSAEGTLNTCSDVNRTSITISNCNQPLTINGPVMAAQVQLWRTAGSDNDDASGNPAEVFNLRPDAYFWGISQSSKSGRLESVYERELPPRF